MDEPELLAFRDSVEYREAQAAWLRKAEKRRAREAEHRQSTLPVKSSWDITRIALFDRHRDAFPWVCLAIVKSDHFDVVKLSRI